MNSMTEHLEREMTCEGLMECLHGSPSLDRRTYRVVAESDEPLTVDEVAEGIDRERSTAYRSIVRLEAAGFVERTQRNYENGGYCHVYRSRSPDDVADDMQRTLNDAYATLGTLIAEFREKYADRVDTGDRTGDRDRTGGAGTTGGRS
jgi:predicted transcriptional regulator